MDQNVDDLMKKWALIFESAGITGSKADWVSEYLHQHGTTSNTNIPLLTTTQSIDEIISNSFPSFLPTGIMSAVLKYFSMDMASVLGISQEQMDRIKAEIKSKNREFKIYSILEGKEFKEKDGGTTSSDLNKDNETIDKLN